MKIKFILTLLLLTFTSFPFSQTETLNQLDSTGKKHGKWIVYLDTNWKKVDDSTKASMMRYTFFDHGINVYPMGPCGLKNYRLESVYGNYDSNAKIKLLDGEFKWFDGKGKLSSVHILKNGEYVSCKEYYPTGELKQHFDYTKKCEGQSLGWTVYIYDKTGNITLTSPICKDKKGNWPVMGD
ncbi:MAG: hypothetical protein H0W84_03760 [Bacteroidetes bacterium]|nr:hypothetical protein [Bacteroidota bacterium]